MATSKSSVGVEEKLVGRLYPNGAWTRLGIREGRIESVESTEAPKGGGDERWLVPGFFDLQVNGFGGGDFCNRGVTLDVCEQVARSVLATGTTRFLPTIITASLDDMCRQLEVIAGAIETVPLFGQMCPGMHVEGPFIHPEDGPRGAHPREHVRPPTIPDFERLWTAAGGKIKILTVAADQPGAPALIAHAVSRGVLVAIGHHRAELPDIEAAVAAGARMCTHLGNGSDATLPRLDNPIWRQLGEDRLWASFIADGHHLPGRTLKCMLRAKTLSRAVLVTDAMSAAGMAPGHYQLGPLQVERTPTGRVVLPGTPYLAGSGADMPLLIARAVVDAGLSFTEAIRLAALNPGQLLLGESPDWRPQTGQPANLVELDWEPGSGAIHIRQAVMGLFAAHTAG